MNRPLATLPLALALLAAAAPAAAQQTGDWTLGFGVHTVDPKSDNGRLADGALPVDVDTDTKPSLTFEYFVRDNLGVEVLAAWPFQHDISIDGVGSVGSTKQLPPTVSLQYHFNSKGKVSPFLGAGLNYTTFFSEDTSGVLEGTHMKLDDSWGLAAHAGLDFAIGERSAIRVDARWIDIDTDVEVNGVDLGTVNIDPIVYGAEYVMRF